MTGNGAAASEPLDLEHILATEPEETLLEQASDPGMKMPESEGQKMNKSSSARLVGNPFLLPELI